MVHGDPMKKTVEMLYEGKILAIKGLGGYHLAVYPKDHGAVTRLRERKMREGKPFALMVRDMDAAQKYCKLDKSSETLLKSIERPIVLLERESESLDLSQEVAPDTPLLGIMLPYTPLHHLLLQEGPEVLVMTSANLSEEPLAFQDEDAFRRISKIADAYLTHNRQIERPCDDSVILSLQGVSIPIRRSRGYVPRSIDIGGETSQIFAAGASEKNTFCVLKAGKAYPSHHIGDLDNEKSVDAYMRGIQDFIKMFRIRPEAVACDLHPDYVSTRIAEDLSKEWDVPLFGVQHHHAHIASVLGENRIEDKVIGVALDGTGYGTDGTIWGGEFLIADTRDFERVGHFAPIPMPGGEKCIIETDRMAISYLISAYGSFSGVPSFEFIDNQDAAKKGLIEKLIISSRENKSPYLNCPVTSSCGRLFDAVSALLGLCTRPAYDAQGAILLETEAGTFDRLSRPYTYTFEKHGVLSFVSTIREIVEDIGTGKSKKIISQRFHSTIILSSVEMCKKIRDKRGIKTVAFSGGVFQNRHIFKHFKNELEKNGFSVLFHTLIPPNDGGISLGQGVVALNLVRGGK
jgi:hydrogenase maturation protein HypF